MPLPELSPYSSASGRFRTLVLRYGSCVGSLTCKPGDRAFFKSRLASPPSEGRSIDVRFFSKRDIAGGSV